MLARLGRIFVNPDFNTIDGYDVPQDPYDLLMCDSCQ